MKTERDRLDGERIRRGLLTKRIGKEVLVYSSTTSTNDVAGEYGRTGGYDGLAIFAEEQTAGRGRGGSVWVSGCGESILCSVLLEECRCGAELLSLACAVAVAEAIGRTGGGEARIKWPNDVQLNGKKVAGILLESKAVSGGSVHVIGIGINCHQGRDSFPEELRGIATSIDIESGSFCDRVSLAKRLLTSLDYWLEAAEQSSERISERWRELSVQTGQRITVIYNGKRFTGHCIGVDPEKGLVLRLDSGGVRMFEAAQTTIAK